MSWNWNFGLGELRVVCLVWCAFTLIGFSGGALFELLCLIFNSDWPRHMTFWSPSTFNHEIFFERFNHDFFFGSINHDIFEIWMGTFFFDTYLYNNCYMSIFFKILLPHDALVQDQQVVLNQIEVLVKLLWCFNFRQLTAYLKNYLNLVLVIEIKFYIGWLSLLSFNYFPSLLFFFLLKITI